MYVPHASIPELLRVAPGAVQAVALVGNGGGLIPTIGLVLGLGVSCFMMYYNIKRAMDLKYDDGDFPGEQHTRCRRALASPCCRRLCVQGWRSSVS